ncbi:MAG: 4-(cytidine 5'-diphospho)-2-C-methyl-D-erythritol kinase [Aquificaceae bacterium]|nr:4-(cytidine 5'-diphospho)-2-C-methyl-D-erythritol kinase [Aquificaceae bacterium]MDW8237312.1 4-(cytidine 5'-diphospho)-2-C-methyl-D-erythritol kinase [Aquificaceae bacterium]
MVILSPAKVNLGLWVLKKRLDGYHDIFTLYHKVSLFDVVHIREGRFSVSTNLSIPMEKNLVYRALLLMSQVLGRLPDVEVFIEKSIPLGSGLGGGSSNVATALVGVNELLGRPLSDSQLKQIAAQVSSDAPFFLGGPSAIGQGRGDVLNEIDLPKMVFTIVCPNVEASSSRVYSALRSEWLTESPDKDKILSCLRRGDLGGLYNALERPACELYPEIGEVLRYLRALGIDARLSGSGACVFYLGEPFEKLQVACTLRGWRLYRVESYGV